MESSAPPVQDKPTRPNLLSSLLDNPVIAKELKGRMRGRQGFILLSSYLALISFFIGLVYLFLSVAGSEVRQVGIPELLGVGAGFVKLSSVRSWQERGTRIVFNESPLRTESLRTMVRRSGALSIVSDWCSRVAVGPF